MGNRQLAGHDDKTDSDERGFQMGKMWKGLKTDLRINNHYDFI